MKYLIYLFALVFFTACGGSKTAEPISYPSWYLNPPANNGSSLYGVGEGKDIASAKNSALSEVGASLSTTVSSVFQKSESSNSYNGDENAYHSALNTVKAQVKEIEFSDYQVIKNEAVSNRFLVLVEVSRQQLFQTQKEKLDRFSNELKEEQNSIESRSAIQQASLYSITLKKTDKLKSLALLCQTIDSGFDTSIYLKQISDIKESEQKALDKITVLILADKDSEMFVNPLKEGLNAAGIKTVSKNANTAVQMTNSFHLDEIYGYKIAKSTLNISTKDINSKNISSKSMALSGKSRYDYKKAKENAALLLSKKIQEDGIFTVLGIE